MEFVPALLLGIVQGLTEFLPISSSGHLVIFQRLLGVEYPGISFEIAVHLGTFLAVVVVYSEDIYKIIAAVVGGLVDVRKGRTSLAVWFQNEYVRLALMIVIGSVPTALIGFTLRDRFEALFSSLTAVGYALLITGLILWLTAFRRGGRRDISGMRFIDALLIGIAQGAAITPGISRSGTTIAAALFLGLDRRTAARYSFLLALPTVLGAGMVDILHSVVSPHPVAVTPMVLGGVTAAIAGWLAIKVLLRFLLTGYLFIFSLYCWLVGLLVLLAARFGGVLG